jgi:hypothetical protein
MTDVQVKKLQWSHDILTVDVWNDDRTERKSVPSSEHWSAAPRFLASDFNITKIVDPRVKRKLGVTLNIGMKDHTYPDVDSAMAAAQAEFERRVMTFIESKEQSGD